MEKTYTIICGDKEIDVKELGRIVGGTGSVLSVGLLRDHGDVRISLAIVEPADDGEEHGELVEGLGIFLNSKEADQLATLLNAAAKIASVAKILAILSETSGEEE